jgi:hypothetical protein
MIERQDECDPQAPPNIPKQLNAFFSGDTPHHHAIGALLI